MENLLERVFRAKSATERGAYKLASFANDLAEIGAEMGKPKGFSITSVSELRKRTEFELSQHREFSKIVDVLQRFCELNGIPFDNQASTYNSSDLTDIKTLDGAWLHFMLDSRSDVESGATSDKIRQSILLVAGGQFTLIGPTTLWRGKARRIDSFFYYDAMDVGEHERAFGIFRRPYPKRRPDEISVQHGIYLGVALSEHDDPRFPIGATRSILRRLDELSDHTQGEEVSESCIAMLRKHFCGYFDRNLLSRRNVVWEHYKEQKAVRRILLEQRYEIKLILDGLEDRSVVPEYGARIVLK